MATLPSIQPSFAAGEISSALYARVDLNAYWIALRTAKNILILPQGGALSRPGSEDIGPCKEHTYFPRLIRWKHSSGSTFFLELGDSYIRFIKDGGHVLEDTIDLAGVSKATPAVITTSSAHGYSTSDEVYVSGAGGMTEVNGRHFLVGTVTGTKTFSIQVQETGSDVNSSGYTTYTSGGTVARVYTKSTPWDSTEIWELDYVATSDVMTLVHKSHNVKELTRDGTASWTLATPTFEPTIEYPQGVGVTVGSTGSETRYYQVTTIGEDGEESLPGLGATTGTTTAVSKANPAVVTMTGHPFADGDRIEINNAGGMTELNGRRFTVANSATNSFELSGENALSYATFSGTATIALTWDKVTNSAATESNTITFSAVSGAQKYTVYRRDDGIFGLLGETKTTSFLDNNIAPDYDFSPPTQRLPFLGSGNRPAAVGLYQQRRVFGGTTNNLDTSQFSRAGNYYNYSGSEIGADDDAFAAILPALEASRIRHYVSRKKLLALTEGAEWTIHYEGSTNGFSLSTARQDLETTHGVGNVKPLEVGKKTLVVQKLGRIVYDISYAFGSDGYEAVDLTALAGHITQQYTLTDWAYSETPYSLVATIRADGVMPVMTFKPEHKVTAWSRWITDGFYGAVAAGPDDLGTDTIYAVVKRTLNSVTQYRIERFRPRTINGDVQDYFGVDCGRSLDSPIAISGATSANPVVITTSSAHGLSNGDEVDIEGIQWRPDVDSDYNETQPAQLNKLGPFKVANKTATTFELTDTSDVDINGSTYNTYVTGGNVRKRVSTVTGLWHLNGITNAAVLYNGSVALDQTITNGTWTVPSSGKASRVHVGLRYNCDLETLNIEAHSGTIQGARKQIPFLWTRVFETAGILVGPDSSHLVPMSARESAFTGGTEATLLSDDVKTILKQHWNTNGRLLYRQPYPLPMGVLAVIPGVNVGEQ